MFTPNLSLLASNYLIASATGGLVEDLFSTCGLILNVKRSSMASFCASIIIVVCTRQLSEILPIDHQTALAKIK